MEALRAGARFPGRLARAAAGVSAAGDPIAPMPLWQQKVGIAHEQFYRASYKLVMQLAVHLVLMDAYLVCRLLRFCTRPEAAGGESIVYVGNAHAEYYVSFFQDYMGLTPVVCQPASAVTEKRRKPPQRMSRGDSNFNRCVPVARHDRRTTCPTVGKRPLQATPASYTRRVSGGGKGM